MLQLRVRVGSDAGNALSERLMLDHGHVLFRRDDDVQEPVERVVVVLILIHVYTRIDIGFFV